MQQLRTVCCSEYQRYQLLRAIHNGEAENKVEMKVVPNIKDINFWEQFTTGGYISMESNWLFRISKISTFESNSQLPYASKQSDNRCSEYQRYQLLRAIHNSHAFAYTSFSLFRISKISTFESNSQQSSTSSFSASGCSEYQRYQLLRAIHNSTASFTIASGVVPNIKDINFWEQFTTRQMIWFKRLRLFRISKISTFESNSQLLAVISTANCSCSEYQRYQLLRAIHNIGLVVGFFLGVVPNIKDINFWEQFTTHLPSLCGITWLFRISKISTFESNSQL